MKGLIVFVTIALLGFKFGSSAGLQNLGNIPGGNRQGNIGGVGGLSFAIPGLSLLAGNNGAGGNFFGPQTVTRTLVSTVSTVTTASYRTCVAPTANLMPCAAGRRRRNLNEGKDLSRIDATPVMQVIVGPTTIRDPVAVEEYLESHKPCTQSVIYPAAVQANNEPNADNTAPLELIETTPLYPSQDTPENTESVNEIDLDDISLSERLTTTETPGLFFGDALSDSTDAAPTVPSSVNEFNGDLDDSERGRVGLGRTTTVTTVIRVTSVATSLATGAMATLTVSYMGCLPQSLPITGPACV